MGKKLPQIAVARREPTMTIASWLALVGLLLIAGCAAGGNGSDNDKQGGFYGGVTGGGSRP